MEVRPCGRNCSNTIEPKQLCSPCRNDFMRGEAGGAVPGHKKPITRALGCRACAASGHALDIFAAASDVLPHTPSCQQPRLCWTSFLNTKPRCRQCVAASAFGY